MDMRKKAFSFIVLIGVISLFADMTYEGARSITGPFLGSLGASAAVVGFVAGFGELAGYGLRLLSGYLGDRTKRYWTFVFVGYFLNLFAVPFLALAGRWEIAAILIILERTGKALRTPSRDTLLSYASKQVGSGWAFGFHEALDQAGAVLGPLIVTLVLFLRGSYRSGFAILLIPALLAMGVLIATRIIAPHPSEMETESAPVEKGNHLPRAFWIYLAAVVLVAAGYADFPLIAYHFGKTNVVPPNWIPIFYSIAMGADALAALLFGRLFDKLGIKVLALVTLISSIFAPLVFLGGFFPALAGMALWGVGMGAQESILRAAVCGMAPKERRATAYGIFNAGYGLFWFLGSALMGILYDKSLLFLILFSVLTQLFAIPIFLLLGKKTCR